VGLKAPRLLLHLTALALREDTPASFFSVKTSILPGRVVPLSTPGTSIWRGAEPPRRVCSGPHTRRGGLRLNLHTRVAISFPRSWRILSPKRLTPLSYRPQPSPEPESSLPFAILTRYVRRPGSHPSSDSDSAGGAPATDPVCLHCCIPSLRALTSSARLRFRTRTPAAAATVAASGTEPHPPRRRKARVATPGEMATAPLAAEVLCGAVARWGAPGNKFQSISQQGRRGQINLRYYSGCTHSGEYDTIRGESTRDTLANDARYTNSGYHTNKPRYA